MKRNLRFLSRASTVPALAALLLSGTSASGQCPAPASWFPSSQTKPFDPASFPADATNCDFHQWAWQTFLWLTQDVKGQMRFTTFPTETDLFDPAEPLKKPALLSAVLAKPRKPLQLKVRSEKEEDGGVVKDINSVAQAGGGGILVDHKGNPVYYSVNFDPVFYDFVQKNQYYDYDKYIAADPTTNYPLGAMELKASWRIVAEGETASGSYVTDALVPVLQQDATGKVTVDTSKPPRAVKVSFVGLHVVGIVANHPEFIWATFEQNLNAPNLPAGMDPKANLPVADTNYTFYTAGTFASACNINAKANLKLDAATQTFTPVTQVYQLNPEGGETAGSGNIANIQALNKSVHDQLGDEVWKNYNLVGGVWLLPGALQPNMPSATQPFELHGSIDLANTTMETYHQNLNCFTCHTTQATSTNSGLNIPAMNMNLSHILTDGLVQRKSAQLLKAKQDKAKADK